MHARSTIFVFEKCQKKLQLKTTQKQVSGKKGQNQKISLILNDSVKIKLNSKNYKKVHIDIFSEP